MSKTLLLASLPLLLIAGASQAQILKTDEDKTFYALGFSQGQRLSVFNLSKAELEVVRKGLADGATNAKPQVDMQTFGPKIGDLARARSEVKAQGDKTKGAEYAAKVAKEPGVVKTGSGLLYKDLKAGSGASPKPTDTVKVNYRGTLIDGTEFDSSYKRNQPAEFPLNGVIGCWTEGLQKMKMGGKARLVCPSSIAYGDAGHPPTIPGGATLIFEVELLEIKAK
jgi:FKBP-type peptidyl-prolyl cis-trans isomerase FkpA